MKLSERLLANLTGFGFRDGGGRSIDCLDVNSLDRGRRSFFNQSRITPTDRY